MTTWQVCAVGFWYAICAVTISTCITGHPGPYYRVLDVAWEGIMRPIRLIEGHLNNRSVRRGQDS